MKALRKPLLLLLCALPAAACAQATPPPICRILYAELAGKNGALTEGVERHYRDNDRITKAMANCSAGTTVVLHGSKTGKAIFLIAPLRLRRGVTLQVDASAELWASREAAAYDIEPGSCSVAHTACRPLLLAEDAAGSGLFGEGILDGRGGEPLFAPDGRERPSWADAAAALRTQHQHAETPRLLLVQHSDGFVLAGLTLRSSPGPIRIESTRGAAISGLRREQPAWLEAPAIEAGPGATGLTVNGP